MVHMRNLMACLGLGLCAGLIGAAQEAYAATVSAQPAVVTFNNMEQGVLVALTHDGKRVLPEAIGKARLMVDDSDYSRMIAVTKTPDGVRVAPSELMEVGSYNLVIETTHGAAVVQVYAPLADLPSLLDAASGPGGPRLGALREELGFQRQSGRASVSIELPAVFTTGSTLRLEMPHDAQREYVWAINGEVVHRGLGMATLGHTFTQPGDYILTYAERINGVTVAQAEAITRVSEPPSLPYAISRGGAPTFEAPEGYAEYQWDVDGEVKSAMRTFTMRFEQVGEYIVTLRATAPNQPPYILRYRTIVE